MDLWTMTLSLPTDAGLTRARLVNSIGGVVAIVWLVVALSPVGLPIGNTRPTLGVMGMGLLGLGLICDELYRHTPQNTAPGCVRFCITLSDSVTIGLSFALAAYKADRLTVPIMHEVKRDAAGQIQRQSWGELKKAITEIGRKYVLMGHKRRC